MGNRAKISRFYPQQTGTVNISRHGGGRAPLVIGILLGLLASGGPAFGQFIVQPMRLDIATPPARTVKTGIDLDNLDPNSTTTIDLTLVDLSQYEDGSWQIIEPGSDFDASKLSSCREWITLSAESVALAPLRRASVEVSLKVPPAIRGFYAAAILASTRPRPDATGVVIRVRFLIPIIVEIQGYVMPHQLDLSDVGMEFKPESAAGPATTLVSLSVANTGGTYCRLDPVLIMWTFRGGHWMKITEQEFKQTGIIPGAELNLKSDIERSLPPGKYKLQGTLYADGRRTKVITKEIEFAGDPTVTRVATDAALDVEPAAVSVDSRPGATRTDVIRVFNASDDTVNVATSLTLPPSLKGVALGGGEVKGDDLDCSDSVKVVPERFRLRSGGSQNLRIIARLPNPGQGHRCYYTQLQLRARYADGQNAGLTTAYICVTNQEAEGRPRAQVERLNIAREKESTYRIAARFSNVGDTHFKPNCGAVIVRPPDVRMTSIRLSGKSSLMLPLEYRDFSGIYDFTDFPEGIYRVVVGLEYAPGEVATKDLPIQVSRENGQKIVEIPTPEVLEKIGVEW
jgi:hypothetical protein